MNIKERTRVGYTHKELSYREEIDYLRRQLRKITERNLSAWEQGFAAAVAMAEAGATPARLREATGVVSIPLEDTLPQFAIDEEPTQVDINIHERF